MLGKNLTQFRRICKDEVEKELKETKEKREIASSSNAQMDQTGDDDDSVKDASTSKIGDGGGEKQKDKVENSRLQRYKEALKDVEEASDSLRTSLLRVLENSEKIELYSAENVQVHLLPIPLVG